LWRGLIVDGESGVFGFAADGLVPVFLGWMQIDPYLNRNSFLAENSAGRNIRFINDNEIIFELDEWAKSIGDQLNSLL
jgi:hypothetical protein